jgi:mycothiol synthase
MSHFGISFLSLDQRFEPTPRLLARQTGAVLEIREIGEEEFVRLVAVRNAVWPFDPVSADDYRDWQRQAGDMASLLVTEAGEDIAGGSGIVGWHSPPGVGRLPLWVLPEHRGRGFGTELLAQLSAWLRARDCIEATSPVFEEDAASLAWAERRGFVEVGRNSMLALDLEEFEKPPAVPPPGVEIVTWADRPDTTRGMYEVVLEAGPDIPGEDEAEIEPFESWLTNDMRGLSDRPEATFVALAGDEVVGFAKLSLSADDNEVAFHDLTGVKRAWRRRGIAGALKRAQIEWARANGYRHLKTFNEERNEPIRRLNERYGYRRDPGFVTVRGPTTVSS